MIWALVDALNDFYPGRTARQIVKSATRNSFHVLHQGPGQNWLETPWKHRFIAHLLEGPTPNHIYVLV